MLTSRDIIAIIVFLGLLIAYIAVALLYGTEEARDLGQLLTLVTVAIVSYYLGYTYREKKQVTTQLTNKSINVNIAHARISYLRRLGYISIGFGIALILQHVVCYGVDITPLSELLLGHEWIGLYAIIIGMVIIGMTQKRSTTVTHNSRQTANTIYRGSPLKTKHPLTQCYVIPR
ncbi:MAG: hypothetical protein DRJ40_11105 [Thermoprotei archaeon]|nr:MAG: hypothetical protein DRJ40_11105 [Thermoprotei archaeon]